MLKLIPRSIINAAAAQSGAEEKARTFSAYSHLGAMFFAQLAHAFSLNDVCDWLRMKARAIASLGMSAPARNTLSHANKHRDASFAEQVFWNTLGFLQGREPGFGSTRPRRSRNYLRRIKVDQYTMDSTVLELVANCMPWAKHRRRKAAAKLHLRLSLNGYLPAFAVVGPAAEHDNTRARELCAGLQAGEVVIFDKAYVDFTHLRELDEREVRWVTRAKENLRYRACRNLPVAKESNIIKDQIIMLKGPKWRKGPFKGWRVRRVEAWVEVDGKMRRMVFLTNEQQWSSRSVCELYRARWDIEVFFKQVKQTLKLGSFLGHSANAIRWQVWTALLVYVLTRFFAYLSQWSHSYTRLFAVIRSAL